MTDSGASRRQCKTLLVYRAAQRCDKLLLIKNPGVILGDGNACRALQVICGQRHFYKRLNGSHVSIEKRQTERIDVDLETQGDG